MTNGGRCNTEINNDEYRDSMHYGKIHNKCHDKMFADLNNNKLQEIPSTKYSSKSPGDKKDE